MAKHKQRNHAQMAVETLQRSRRATVVTACCGKLFTAYFVEYLHWGSA